MLGSWSTLHVFLFYKNNKAEVFAKIKNKLRTIEAWLQSEGGTPILNLTRMIVVTFRDRNCGFGFS